MKFPILIELTIATCLIACKHHPSDTKFDFWSVDRSSGVFFNGDKLSVGSVEYENGKVFDKGVESKGLIVRTETSSATCLSSNGLVMALPKVGGIQDGRARCGNADFIISPCVAKDACSGFLVTFRDLNQARGSPRWYSYDLDRGVTKISFDPRGISFNTMSLEEKDGPKATED